MPTPPSRRRLLLPISYLANHTVEDGFDERQDVVWRRELTTGEPRRNIPPALICKEVETCGLCHARRSQFAENWVPGPPLSDTHVVAPLTRGLYDADGQMRDEVYNYGSFKQSKMFAAGSESSGATSGQICAAGTPWNMSRAPIRTILQCRLWLS